MSLEDLLKILAATFGLLAAILTIVGWFVRRMIRSHEKNTKARIEAHREKANAEIKQAEAQLRSQIAEQETRFAQDKLKLQSEIVRLQQACRDAETERDDIVREAEIDRERALKELADLQKRLAGLESFNGRLWERELTTVPPSFLDMTRRKTRFISVMNLKGGVGKTTLTANIGVGLARKGYRVLLVDTDFQGSLTRLCIDFEELQESIARHRTTDRLLEMAGGSAAKVVEVAQRVRSVMLDEGSCDLVAATEDLAEAELRAQGRWLAIDSPDARFLFRTAFHRPDVCSAYDYVFFDCPPRLTTASINAFACCDYLLVPVLLEQGSVEALPRTLNWLKRLPHVSHARLLGVIANRAEYRGTQLIASQRTIFNYLPETIQRSDCGNAGLFRAVVRNNRNRIEDAANHGRIAAAKDDGLQLFAEVVAEVEKGIQA